MAEIVGVTASIVTLVATARTISTAFNLVAAVRECPKEIENLRREHDSLTAALERLDNLIQTSQDGDNPSSSFVEQVNTVVGDTGKTLDELQTALSAIQPSGFRTGKRAAFQMRYKYFWKERTIQAIMARVQARRDSLTLMLNMWSSADAQEMRKQLDSIRLSLESCLFSIRGVSVAPATSGPPSPVSDASEINEWSDASSSISLGSRAESATSISEMALNGQPVLDLARRFDRALNTGRQNGPQGENIRRRIAQLNATKSSAIGASISKAARPVASTANPRKGKSPDTNKIRSLAQSLASREANASGIWNNESAAAAQALAKAYQEVEDFESALEYYHLALFARESLLGPTHLSTLTTMDLIAGLLELQSRWQDALEYYQHSLAGRASNPNIGKTHPTYLPIATRIGRMYKQMDESELALQQYASILDQYSTMAGKGGVAAMAVRAEIVKVQLQRGEFAEGSRSAEAAISEYQKLLHTREANFPPGHHLITEARTTLESMQNALQDAQIAQGTASAPADSSVPALAAPVPGGGSPSMVPSSLKSNTNKMARCAPTQASTPTVWAPEIAEYEAKLERVRLINGNNHPETLQLMCSLADAYASHEQYEAAVSWFHEALRGQEITFGEKHPTTLATVHNLGICYASTKDNAAALKYLECAVTGRTWKLAKNHPDTITSIVQLATVYRALGEYTKALDLIDRAVASYTEKYGAKHPKTLSAEFQRGKILHKKGALSAAQRVHESVLRDREAMHPPAHPQVLASKVELGQVYREQKAYEKATALLLAAYEGQKTTFGQLNALTTGTAHDLAMIYWETEKWQQALDFYLIVLEGLQNGHDAGPTAGSVTMHNIAMCYAQLEMHNEAISWFEKVFKLYETEFGRDHEKTVSALMHVAHQYFTCDMFDEAIGHYRRMLTVKEQVLPDSDEAVILLIFQLFRCTSQSGQNEKAMVWGRRFVAVGETSDLEKRLIVKKGMGNIHAKNKQYSEALDLYLEVLSDTKFLDQDHWLHNNVVYDIHRLYAEMDGDNEAVQDLKRQREMISQVLDSDPRAGAILLHQLGHVYARQHMQHEALSLLEEALEAIQCLPLDSELISLKHNAISGIADAHLELYNNQAALTYLRILVDSEEDAGWKVGAMIRMAGALEQEGEFEQAIELWKQVRREEERKSGVDTVDVLCTARKIGSLYLRIGNTREALRWTEGTLAGLRRCNDPEARLQEMRTLSLMSSLHWELGDLHNALSTQRACVTGLEVTLGESDEQTLSAYFDLGEICNTLGEVREALQWYRKAITGYKLKLDPVKAMNAEQRVRELERRAAVGEV